MTTISKLATYVGIALSIGYFALAGTSAQAAQISQIKGKSALIDTQGEALKAGDALFAIDLSGKRVGLIRISKVRGTKAIGRIEKGTADVGMTVGRNAGAATAPRSSSYRSSSPSGSSNYSSSNSRMAWGGMLGILSGSMTADITTDTGVLQGSAATTGMSFSAMGLFDYQVANQIYFRGLGGIQNFKTSGPSKCGEAGNQKCDVDIMYLSATGLGRYVFSTGNIRPWAGGGLGLLFPATKKSSLLQGSSITTTYALIATGGVDWYLNSSMYIPISVEYGLFPKSDTVEASWLQLRFGLAYPF